MCWVWNILHIVFPGQTIHRTILNDLFDWNTFDTFNTPRWFDYIVNFVPGSINLTIVDISSKYMISFMREYHFTSALPISVIHATNITVDTNAIIRHLVVWYIQDNIQWSSRGRYQACIALTGVWTLDIQPGTRSFTSAQNEISQNLVCPKHPI